MNFAIVFKFPTKSRPYTIKVGNKTSRFVKLIVFLFLYYDHNLKFTIARSVVAELIRVLNDHRLKNILKNFIIWYLLISSIANNMEAMLVQSHQTIIIFYRFRWKPSLSTKSKAYSLYFEMLKKNFRLVIIIINIPNLTWACATGDPRNSNERNKIIHV